MGKNCAREYITSVMTQFGEKFGRISCLLIVPLLRFVVIQ